MNSRSLPLGALLSSWKGFFPSRRQLRAVPEQGPVAALHRQLLLRLAHLHALGDAVVDAGGVSDDEGRALVGLGLLQGLHHVGGVGAMDTWAT